MKFLKYGLLMVGMIAGSTLFCSNNDPKGGDSSPIKKIENNTGSNKKTKKVKARKDFGKVSFVNGTIGGLAGAMAGAYKVFFIDKKDFDAKKKEAQGKVKNAQDKLTKAKSPKDKEIAQKELCNAQGYLDAVTKIGQEKNWLSDVEKVLGYGFVGVAITEGGEYAINTTTCLINKLTGDRTSGNNE